MQLASSDPFAQPKMHANYLATDTDKRVTIDGIHLVRRIMAQPAMMKFNAQEMSPGVDAQSDARDVGLCP